MKNKFVQPGHIIDVFTPEGGMVAGTPYIFNSLFGIAATNTEWYETNSLHVTGVFEFEKGGMRGALLGEPAYYNPANHTVGPDPVVGHYKIGVIVGVDFMTPYQVRLNGTDVAAVEA